MIPFIEIDERLKTKKFIALRLFSQRAMRQVKLLRGNQVRVSGSLAEHGHILVIVSTLNLGSSWSDRSSGKNHEVLMRGEPVVALASACWAGPDVSDELTVEVDGVIRVEVATRGTAGSELARVPVEAVTADGADISIELLHVLPGAGFLDVCDLVVTVRVMLLNEAQKLESGDLLVVAVLGDQLHHCLSCRSVPGLGNGGAVLEHHIH